MPKANTLNLSKAPAPKVSGARLAPGAHLNKPSMYPELQLHEFLERSAKQTHNVVHNICWFSLPADMLSCCRKLVFLLSKASLVEVWREVE